MSNFSMNVNGQQPLPVMASFNIQPTASSNDANVQAVALGLIVYLLAQRAGQVHFELRVVEDNPGKALLIKAVALAVGCLFCHFYDLSNR